MNVEKLKMKKTINTLGIISLIIIALSCANIKKNQQAIKLPKSLKNKYAFIPEGKVVIEKDTFPTNEFYISTTEISNAEYLSFIKQLQEINQIENYKIANIDSAKWELEVGYSSPYINYYFRHNAYSNYPVVNISYEGAKLYCEWLTEKTNKENKNDNLCFEFRLPTRKEWIKAAQGKSIAAAYSWGSSYLRNGNGKNMCNYLTEYSAENIHFNDNHKRYEIINIARNDAPYITAPVKTYWPNYYGLFNMNGNVAEMVEERGIAVGGSWQNTGYDVRNESIMKYEGSSARVGFRPVMVVKKK